MYLTFKPLSLEDATQLHEWLQLPHVREFWDNGLRTIPQVMEFYFQDNGVKRFLFYIDDQPAGYIQSYVVDPSNHYYQYTLPQEKTMGVDIFMGNTHYLGKGLAKMILQNFIKQICYDADRILIDPESTNARAIHVYQKCGFVKVAECVVENKNLQIMLAVPVRP